MLPCNRRLRREKRTGPLGMAGPGTNNSKTPPYPIWGFDPLSPEPDSKKLDALLASLNSSADRFQTLWFSFLGLWRLVETIKLIEPAPTNH
jgi:hypothetical protein